MLDNFAQSLVLGLQLIHLVQLLADEALGKRMFDVVTAVDGEEEIIQGGLHVTLVIRFYGIVILSVCLALRQRRVDGVLVVILAGKLLHLVADEYLAGTDRFLQTDSLQTGAAG